MPRPLPSKPNLVQLKHQAKNLLKAHHQGEKTACRTLRLLHRFADQSDEAILSAALTLAEAQYALAMDYGFESWAALKSRVESAPAPKASVDSRRPCRPYSYTAASLGRGFQTGVVNACNVGDAVWKMRKDGLIPLSLQKQGAAQEDSLAGSPKGQVAAARRAVELILLSLVDAADKALHIGCGFPSGKTSEVQPDGTLIHCTPGFSLRGPAQKVSGVPFPKDIGGPELLEALREMSGDRRLGRATVRVRRVVTIGQDLSGGTPRRIDLLFRSDDKQMNSVLITLNRPGSRGLVRASREKIFNTIVGALDKYHKVHVLTPTRARVQEIAKALADRTDAKQVGVVERSTASAPDAPIVVADVGEMCLCLIRARIRGEAAARAFEGALPETCAVCVDLVPGQFWPWSASTISRDEEVLGSMKPGTLLMLYRRVWEFRQTEGK